MNKQEILTKFGQAVRAHRKALGLSQEKFAEIAGCHRTYVGMVERAEKNLTLSNIYKFAKALGVTVSELTEGI